MYIIISRPYHFTFLSDRSTENRKNCSIDRAIQIGNFSVAYFCLLSPRDTLHMPINNRKSWRLSLRLRFPILLIKYALKVDDRVGATKLIIELKAKIVER